jgi:cytochrome c-type protein NapC
MSFATVFASVKDVARQYWVTLSTPSKVFSLGFLTIAGFVAGIVFWGGFNTALEVTNTEKFCIGCHEMRDNVFVELQPTIHYTNRSGVRSLVQRGLSLKGGRVSNGV